MLMQECRLGRTTQKASATSSSSSYAPDPSSEPTRGSCKHGGGGGFFKDAPPCFVSLFFPYVAQVKVRLILSRGGREIVAFRCELSLARRRSDRCQRWGAGRDRVERPLYVYIRINSPRGGGGILSQWWCCYQMCPLSCDMCWLKKRLGDIPLG